MMEDVNTETSPVDRIQEAFDLYHSEHPEVYQKLVSLAYEWKNHGGVKLGMKTLYERLRWEWHVGDIKDSAGFKLNNNFTAIYARKIMKENPDLKGLFELRERISTKSVSY